MTFLCTPSRTSHIMNTSRWCGYIEDCPPVMIAALPLRSDFLGDRDTGWRHLAGTVFVLQVLTYTVGNAYYEVLRPPFQFCSGGYAVSDSEKVSWLLSWGATMTRLLRLLKVRSFERAKRGNEKATVGVRRGRKVIARPCAPRSGGATWRGLLLPASRCIPSAPSFSIRITTRQCFAES